MSEKIFNNVKITSSFDIPEAKENLVSGETIGKHFGKIAKHMEDESIHHTVDSELSDTSTNPAQSKAIKAELDKKADKSEIPIIDDKLSITSTNPLQNKVATEKFASKEIYGGTTINVGRMVATTVGTNSSTIGVENIASGMTSFAEGYKTTASGSISHAEGRGTIANGDCSHAEGFYTITNNEVEHASGQYNVSNEDTLFSVGDGTDNNNRHNAFEITKTGGKLHDRDIGISYTQAETSIIRIEMPDSVDVAQWLVQNAKSGMQYFISSRSSRTNLPNVSADWMWFSYDGNKYFARAWTGGTHTVDFVLDTVNNIGGWKEISYTPIKSTTISGTTDDQSDLLAFGSDSNLIPICAFCRHHYCTPMLSNNGSRWIHMVSADGGNCANVAFDSVTVYYIES